MITHFKVLLLLLFIILINNDLFSQNTTNKTLTELHQKMFKARKIRDFDSTIYYLKKLDDYSILNNLHQEKHNTKLLRFDAYVIFEKHSKALELGLTIFNYLQKDQEYLKCSRYWRVVKYLSDFMVSIKNYQEALEYLNSYKKTECEADKSKFTDYSIAQVLVKMGLKDSALVLMNNYTTNLTDTKFTNQNLISIHNKVGLLYKSADRYDLAISHFNYVLLLIDSLKIRPNLKPTILGNIGSCYLKMNNLNKAYSFLTKDSKGSLANNSYDSYYNAELALARIDYLQKRYSVAIKRLKSIINSNISLSHKIKEESYVLIIEIQEVIGDMKGTLKSLRMQSLYSDSLAQTTRRSNETYIRTNSDLMYNSIKEKLKIKEGKRKREKLLLLEKLKLKRDNTIYISLIFILIVLILVVYLRKILIDKKRIELIKEQEIKIAQQLIKFENEQKKLLEIKVKQRNKRINSQALELESKKQSASRIVKNLESSITISKSELLSFEIFVQNELEIKSIRGQIQTFIGDIGEDYIDNLKLKHPLLTDNEVKLSIMVLLKLSNKEIAISQNSTPNTIKTSKNRLKKKLKLSADDSLYHYLFTLV